jgi:biotin transporter BioY
VFRTFAYLVPTFVLGLVWHPRLFNPTTKRARSTGTTFGFLSMFIQASIFAWLYESAFAHRHGVIETAFTAVQWTMVAPLTVLAGAPSRRIARGA